MMPSPLSETSCSSSTSTSLTSVDDIICHGNESNEYCRPTRVLVNLDTIVDNVTAMRNGSRHIRFFAPVIKANAYGHGAVRVARKLCDANVVDALVVALVEEAIELRQQQVHKPIIITAGNFRNAYDKVVRYSLTPVVGSVEDLKGLSHAARCLDRHIKVHLEVDVGMARLGFSVDDLPHLKAMASHLPNLSLSGVMGHPSHAELPDALRTTEQSHILSQAFETVGTSLDHGPIQHMANSGALASSNETFDLVRVGLATFGVQPVPALPIAGILPALEWTTEVVAIRTIQKDETVGYDGRWTAPRQSTIATLAVGYADGYPRALSNKAEVLVEGSRAKVVGLVCMDYTMIEVTDIADVRVGSKVTLIGGSDASGAPSAADLARWAETIPWEILSRISSRVPREYIDSASSHSSWPSTTSTDCPSVLTTAKVHATPLTLSSSGEDGQVSGEKN